MLTEYALTPHVFDHEHNAADQAWLRELRAFGERLLPAGEDRIYNNVISDLCDGHWFANEIAPMINRLQQQQNNDSQQRIPALDLLKSMRPRLEGHLVTRPFTGISWPQDEDTWAGEAVASGTSTRIPIHRIVTSSQLATNSDRTALKDAVGEAFWEPVPPVSNPRADLAEQLALLCRMTAFYSFLAFASPQISAEGSGKDLSFAVNLVKAALDRPPGFLKLQRFDFHTEGIFRSDAERQSQANAILDRVKDEIGSDAGLVRVFLWRDLKERRLVVGRSDGSDRMPKIVWAVAMTHVVRPDSDNRDRDRHTFTVLPRAELSRLASDFYTATRVQPYPGSPFRRSS
jgi:hypothetical protein